MSKNTGFGEKFGAAYETKWGELQGFIFRSEEELNLFKQIAEKAEIGGRIVAEPTPEEWKKKNKNTPDYQFKYESPAVVDRREASKREYLAKKNKSADVI
jgi:hypothetical protein